MIDHGLKAKQMEARAKLKILTLDRTQGILVPDHGDKEGGRDKDEFVVRRIRG